MHVDRGCGSWQCGCKGYHSVPFKVKGKSGSAEITILPGPKGLGIVSNDVAKRVLTLAGIKDVWTFTQGETRTKVSMAYATYNALKAIVSTRGVI
jgi:small subunit ribosomal protein S5